MQKLLRFIFYYRDARLTLAFVKNLCFSNSAAVGLNRKEDTGVFIIGITQQENPMERKTNYSGIRKKKGFGD